MEANLHQTLLFSLGFIDLLLALLMFCRSEKSPVT